MNRGDPEQRRKARRAYYAANRDKIAARKRDYDRRRYEADPEYYKHRYRKRVETSDAHELELDVRRAYYQANRDAHLARFKAYYRANRDRLRAKQKAERERKKACKPTT